MLFNLPYDLLYRVLDFSLTSVSIKKNLSATCDQIKSLVYEIIAERAEILYNKCNLWIHYGNHDIFTSCTRPNVTLLNILKKVNIYRSGLKCSIICNDYETPINLNFDIASLAIKFTNNRQLMIRVKNKRKK